LSAASFLKLAGTTTGLAGAPSGNVLRDLRPDVRRRVRTFLRSVGAADHRPGPGGETLTTDGPFAETSDGYQILFGAASVLRLKFPDVVERD
jgi:hypothetical protein